MVYLPIIKFILSRFLASFMVFTFMMPALLAQSNDEDVRLKKAESLILQLFIDLKNSRDYDDHAGADIIDAYLDVNRIAQAVTGPYWSSVTEDESFYYTTLYYIFLIPQINALILKMKGLEFTPTKTVTHGEDLIIVSGIAHDNTGKTPSINLSWHLTTSYKIIDLEVEKQSMLQAAKAQNTEFILQNDGDLELFFKAIERANDEWFEKTQGI